MLKINTSIVMLIIVLNVILTTKATFTSEDIDKISNTLYSAVTSILGSTDSSSSRHQHRRTYDASPCINNGCKLNNSPTVVGASSLCSTSGGCSPAYQQNHPKNIANVGYSIQPSYTNDGHGNYNLHQSNMYRRPPVSNYQSSHNGYKQLQPTNSVPYPYWHGNANNYGYQGQSGYSIHDHSLKINTEYTETGSHAGPLQQAQSGYGYSSGYGGGYSGLFNRPVF